MAIPCSAPDCDEQLAGSSPGVNVDESPYYQLTREKPDCDRQHFGTHRFDYFCSHECVIAFAQREINDDETDT